MLDRASKATLIHLDRKPSGSILQKETAACRIGAKMRPEALPGARGGCHLPVSLSSPHCHLLVPDRPLSRGKTQGSETHLGIALRSDLHKASSLSA